MENKIKHLEMIQGIITRMANNSFALKGWTVGLAAALLTLAGLATNNPIYFAVPYIPVLVFWFLDSYYLTMERRYRKLYALVSNKNESEIDFSMKITKPNKMDKTRFWDSFISKTECIFYISLIVVISLIIASIFIFK